MTEQIVKLNKFLNNEVKYTISSWEFYFAIMISITLELIYAFTYYTEMKIGMSTYEISISLFIGNTVFIYSIIETCRFIIRKLFNFLIQFFKIINLKNLGNSSLLFYIKIDYWLSTGMRKGYFYILIFILIVFSIPYIRAEVKNFLIINNYKAGTVEVGDKEKYQKFECTKIKVFPNKVVCKNLDKTVFINSSQNIISISY